MSVIDDDNDDMANTYIVDYVSDDIGDYMDEEDTDMDEEDADMDGEYDEIY